MVLTEIQKNVLKQWSEIGLKDDYASLTTDLRLGSFSHQIRLYEKLFELKRRVNELDGEEIYNLLRQSVNTPIQRQKPLFMNDSNFIPVLKEILNLENKSFKNEWLEVSGIRHGLIEVFSLLRLDRYPNYNTCAKNSLYFLGITVNDIRSKEDLENYKISFENLKQIYLEFLDDKPLYTRDECEWNEKFSFVKDELGLDEDSFNRLLLNMEIDQLLNRIDKGDVHKESFSTTTKFEGVLKKISSHQIILFGPPGTGKTFHTRDISINIIEGKNGQE